MGRIAYLILGMLALGAAGIADYRGWTLLRPTEKVLLRSCTCSPVPVWT